MAHDDQALGQQAGHGQVVGHQDHGQVQLGGQAGQVQRLEGLGIGLTGIEAAGQQDFVDQLIQLADAARDFPALGGTA